MDGKVEELLHTAFNAYMAYKKAGGLQPSDDLLPYDFDLKDRQITMWGHGIIKQELEELTNRLHCWRNKLQSWHAWNLVLNGYDDKEAWEIRREFQETIVHYCLLQPSTIRDTFIFVATNALHQVRLASEQGYEDRLKFDPTPAEPEPHPSRRKKQERLRKLIDHWPEAKAFMTSLCTIDDEQYKDVTSDFRNMNSHAIGPRLAIGMTRVVTREVVPAEKLEKQSDRTFKLVEIPGQMQTRYGLGGTSPLNLEDARIANLEQYKRARECYVNYRALLSVGAGAIPLAN